MSVPSGDAAEIPLFFPITESLRMGGWRMAELAAFMAYKGVPIEGHQSPDFPPGGGRFVFYSPLLFAGDRCVYVYYKPTVCRHAYSPPPGAIIVMLPDDAAGAVAATALQAKPMFTYRPFAVSETTRPVFSLLSGASILFWNKPLPEHWLELRVLRSP